MKFFVSILFIIFYSQLINAKQIDSLIAKQVGINFLKNRVKANDFKNVSTINIEYISNDGSVNNLKSSTSINYFYVFNVDLKGFIIVSADDIAEPILGYSIEGTFNKNEMPQNVAKWLEGYKKEISYAIEQKILPSQNIQEKWKSLLSNQIGNSIEKSSVNPLIKTKWDQSPYYNALCPGGSVSGCVATAMAQIMKFWNYPATGSGFHSYNHSTYGTISANFGSTTYQWSSMPNSVNSSNNAVATLMLQCGISVDMDYSPQSSGAYVIENSPTPEACSEYSLKNYFGYKNTLHGVERENYTTTQWLDLLKTELNLGRPILYAGFGGGSGHCFVADGYDNNNFIHFNWGWGGQYDSFFQIDALNPDGTGTGGGSGGYNSGHQAIIGIEPPASNQTLNMALYNNVTPSANKINYAQAFNVTTNIANNGSTTFNGDYSVAVFDDNYNFVDYVQTLKGYTLQGGYAYQSNLTFSTTGLFSMLPGTYYLGVFYRPTDGNWKQVSNSGNYSNLVQIKVENSNDIELNSSMVITPGTTLTQGKSASVNLNILNDGTTTFKGSYSVGLYILDGTLAQTIGTMNESNGLPSTYTYQSPFLTFNTSSITVMPGTYLLAAQHNPNNTGWQLTGSSYYLNPIKIIVKAADILPDMYEVNNNVNLAYSLPLIFSNNSALLNTTGSNCHITSDNDFYKIVLPTGYKYTIIPRIHDAYNSSNGSAYTLDGVFSYSLDGTNWSDVFDDVMVGNIVINGGSITVYIRVAPYFSGDIGTYLLSMSINRVSTLGINESVVSENIKVYPNPAKDFITINTNEINGHIEHVNLISIQGQIVNSIINNDELKILNVPLQNIAEGIYLLQIQTNSGVVKKQIVVIK